MPTASYPLKDAFAESKGSTDAWSEGDGSNGLRGRYFGSVLGTSFGILGLLTGAIFLIVSAAEFDPDPWTDHKRSSTCVEDPGHDGMWLCPKLVDILDENYKHYGLTVAGIVLVCAGFVVTVIAAAPLYAASEIMQLKKKAETTAQTDEARAYWREEYEFKFNSFNRSVELLSSAAFTTVNDVQIRPLLPTLAIAP